MDKKQVLLKLQLVFEKVFQKKITSLDFNTSSKDIEGWDSLKHVQLIYETEQLFDIHFRLSEMVEIKSVGDICEAVLKKKI